MEGRRVWPTRRALSPLAIEDMKRYCSRIALIGGTDLEGIFPLIYSH